MIDVEPLIEETFGRLYPNEAVTPDWKYVLDRAGVRTTRVSRRRLLVASLALAALGAGAALAANSWLGSNFTPADLERQYTVITNDRWLQCGKDGCVTRTGTHKQVEILPSMGVSFVLPSGFAVMIVPAAGGLGPLPTYLDDERVRYGLPGVDRANRKFTRGSVEYTRIGGSWTVDLPDGVKRTIAWRRETGSISVTDRSPDGSTQQRDLHAGDVIPLVPGSIDPRAHTLEKAVTFDLPSGARVHIFPTFNATYVGALPLPARPRPPQTLSRAEAERYGLTPLSSFEAILPLTNEGGEWRVTLDGGIERTISWNAGDDTVTIRDRRGDGATREQRVPIGHELPLVPFR